MIILILIISYILIFYRNFELIFEFMALKRAPISGRNVCLSFFLFLRFFISNSDNFNRRLTEIIIFKEFENLSVKKKTLLTALGFESRFFDFRSQSKALFFPHKNFQILQILNSFPFICDIKV